MSARGIENRGSARSVYHVGSVCASNAHSTQRSVLANGEEFLQVLTNRVGLKTQAAEAAEAELRKLQQYTKA